MLLLNGHYCHPMNLQQRFTRSRTPKKDIQIALQCSDTVGPDIMMTELQYDKYLIQDDQWIFRAHIADGAIEGVKAIRMR